MFGWLGAVASAVQGGLCWILTTVGTVPAEALKKGLDVAKAVVCGEPPTS